MKRLDIRGIVGTALLLAGAIAIVGGFGVNSGNAADPDRYVFESDRFDRDLEYKLERALGRLEELEALEHIGDDMEFLGDEIATMVEGILEGTSVRIDADWPDVIYVDPDHHDITIDTRRLARDVERMARQIERDVVRSVERSTRDGRAWRVERYRDRADIESEMRDLQREMRRLERELERMEADGDI